MDQLALALRYVGHGWTVVQLHSNRSGVCSCPDGEHCTHKGEHPRKRDWVRHATADRQKIIKLWHKKPDANIGIVMGPVSGILAIVCEPALGGIETLRRLQRELGSIQAAVAWWRDAAGAISIFQHPPFGVQSGELGAGLTVLSAGNYVIAPRSRDSSGSRCAWPKETSDNAQTPRPLPAKWLDYLDRLHGDCEGAASLKGDTVVPTVLFVRAADIRPEKIEWMWPGVAAIGRVTGLVGFPGLGKSQVAIDMAATVSTGRQWPGGVSAAESGDVIILSAEDGRSDTIVPRLIAAGADTTRIHIATAVTESDGSERFFNLVTDLERLEAKPHMHQVRLLIIDPASAYLGSTGGKRVSRNHSADVRAIQHRLGAFASKHQLSIVSISHLTKTSGAKALTRVTGSVEWVAAPRAVFLVTDEAGTDRRLFLPLKNNLGPDRQGYAFRIESRLVGDGIETSAVRWEPEPVTITADEALVATAGKRTGTSEAIAFLEQALSDGPVDQTEIVRLGKEAGLTEKALRTARDALGVKSTKKGFGPEGKWVLALPDGATVLKLIVDNQPKNQGHENGCKRDISDPNYADRIEMGQEPGKEDRDAEVPDGP